MRWIRALALFVLRTGAGLAGAVALVVVGTMALTPMAQAWPYPLWGGIAAGCLLDFAHNGGIRFWRAAPWLPTYYFLHAGALRLSMDLFPASTVAPVCAFGLASALFLSLAVHVLRPRPRWGLARSLLGIEAGRSTAGDAVHSA